MSMPETTPCRLVLKYTKPITGGGTTLVTKFASELFDLKLNEDKTRLVSFSREARRLGQHQGGFDFLGFCFYWGRSRQGALIPKLKTSSSRLRAKLQRVKSWLRAVSCRFPVRVWWPIFCAKLRGHVQYFGVSFNLDAVKRFLYHATRHAFRRLNRRSQRRSYSWAQFWRFVERHPLPRARVCHSLMWRRSAR